MSSRDPYAVGVISDLWRYPVKSFQGQRDRRAFLSPLGLLGDRRCVVVGVDDDLPVRAMQHPVLLSYGASFSDPDRGEGVVVTTPAGDELPWDDPALPRELGEVLDREVRVVRAPVGIHDVLPLQLTTEASMREAAAWVGLDVDRRRFRPGIVVDTDDDVAFAEAEWPGHRLLVGDDVVLEVVVAAKQSRVISYDPDTLERTHELHVQIAQRRENLFGTYCRVRRGGWVGVGDRVMLDPVPMPDLDGPVT